MNQNRVDTHMHLPPAETDGFAGAIAAFCELGGRTTQVASATVYDNRVPRIRFAIPECVPFADFPELSRVLAEFAESVQSADELAKKR